ncbi:hypothetical protein T459_31895 [Capsicum annuum]|uniref:F-box domain-containing protein n=1 Tax=Capsicum annuum TaxID=4072 RepID=A0A2G2Y3A3_CAPAN|nr:hypothetical protein T459_31895 [Capsicum annuum]
MSNFEMEIGVNWNCVFSLLPYDCTGKILALTSPVDVCRVSLVSKSLQSAADSDSVWEKFLPSDYESIISGSVNPIPDFASKKELYVYLCHNPILINEGRKCFSLDKWSGKKCYFLGGRNLNISWDTPKYLKWISLPDSRFPEVAKLDYDWCLDIQGTIRAGVLSPRTSYAAYFVYKLKNESEFHLRPVNVSVGIFGVKLETRLAFLVPVKDRPQHRNHIDAEDVSEPKPKPEQLDDDFEESIAEKYRRLLDRLWQHIPENATGSVRSIVQRPKLRDDGWLEVELGEFYTENEEDCIEMNLNEVDDCAFLKKGLIIEGIEIRPRMG